MSKFKILADKAISEYKGGSIDEYLTKVSKDNSLNSNEHQRLVEEYNVGAFLSKLQDGSHHEEYDVASPVVAGHSSSSDNDSELGKVAGYRPSMLITDDMFHVDFNDDFCDSGDLQKVAAADVDFDLFSSEEKWEKADLERKEVVKNNNNGLEKMASDDLFYLKLGELTKIASSSDGEMKSAVSALALAGKVEAAEFMIENSKFSTSDILDAEIGELSKEAVSLVLNILEF